MANIKFPKKQFEKEVGKLDKEMQKKIALFGTPLEGFDDEEIEIEVFPNRPDLLSYQGFKRSFLAYLGKQKGLKNYKVEKPEKNYVVKIDSSVKNVRPHTVCAIVKGIKFDDERIKEIIEIQEKLHFTVGRKRKKLAIGIYPLEEIKLPITFKALEPDKIKFVPLESEREMSGLQILQKHPKGKEYAHLLAGKQKFPIFIDADKNILSMPPIINSHSTGKVSEKTKDVFVECSGFDLNALNKCLNIIVTTLADMGGKIYQMELQGKKKVLTPDLSSEKRKVDIDKINSVLGLDLKEKQIKEFLERMGHDYVNKIVSVGAWRTDVQHEVDIIEDVAIAYGYDKFVPEIPKVNTIGSEDKNEIVKRKIAEILAGLNFNETSSFHLTTKRDQFKKMGAQEEDFVEIEESKTEYNILRKDLAHYLMKIFSENVDSEYPQRIFEIGKVFGSGEKENLALAIAPSNFTEVRQILEYLARMLNVEFEFLENEENNFLIKGRTAEIKLDRKKVGFIGEVHPKILRNWKIKMPVSIFEISLEEIFEKILKGIKNSCRVRNLI